MAKKTKTKPKVTAGAGFIMIEIDNPLYQAAHDGKSANPRKIQAAYNYRESYVGFLFGKGTISEADKRAGDRVRQAFETMGGAGAQAIDYSRTKVDGGKIADPISVRQLEAGATLREVHQRLGPEGHDLVIKLCGECRWPKDLSPSGERQRYYSMRLRECLETLAIHWGFRSGKMKHAHAC